jgi:hypothetical protein
MRTPCWWPPPSAPSRSPDVLIYVSSFNTSVLDFFPVVVNVSLLSVILNHTMSVLHKSLYCRATLRYMVVSCTFVVPFTNPTNGYVSYLANKTSP